jgi:hypothetical protein
MKVFGKSNLIRTAPHAQLTPGTVSANRSPRGVQKRFHKTLVVDNVTDHLRQSLCSRQRLSSHIPAIPAILVAIAKDQHTELNATARSAHHEKPAPIPPAQRMIELTDAPIQAGEPGCFLRLKARGIDSEKQRGIRVEIYRDFHGRWIIIEQRRHVGFEREAGFGRKEVGVHVQLAFNHHPRVGV